MQKEDLEFLAQSNQKSTARTISKMAQHIRIRLGAIGIDDIQNLLSCSRHSWEIPLQKKWDSNTIISSPILQAPLCLQTETWAWITMGREGGIQLTLLWML